MASRSQDSIPAGAVNSTPDELCDEEQGYPESWLPWKHPEQPRTLVGEIAGYDLAPDLGYGRQWVCTIVDQARKRWSLWIGKPPETPASKASVLWYQFDEYKPMPGEKVTVRHVGWQDKPKRGGNPYRNIRLTVDRGQQLPEFLARPQLEAAQDADSDAPVDTTALPDVADADVVQDDEPIPF
jgi:hypothetical protein